VENAVPNAVKGLEPRIPELEIPPSGAGVGVKGSVELRAARERFQPLPYPAPAGRPHRARGGIVGGEEKAKETTPGPGFRVFKVRVRIENRKRLKELYNDVISKKVVKNGLLYYWEEWARMFENTKRIREEAGKRRCRKHHRYPCLSNS
jgi:hypothetical protein